MRGTAVLCALAVVVPASTRADTAKPAPTPTAPAPQPPDEITDTEAKEANLESNSPRSGLTFSAAFFGGIMMGGALGVGRGPGISLRIGHVATRKTVITFEFAGSGALHKPSMTQTLTDSNLGLLVGAQRYTSGSSWVRLSGGLNILTRDVGSGSTAKTNGGVGGLVGGGLDLARWGYLVFGLESYALASVTGNGFKMNLCFGLGLSYY